MLASMGARGKALFIDLLICTLVTAPVMIWALVRFFEDAMVTSGGTVYVDQNTAYISPYLFTGLQLLPLVYFLLMEKSFGATLGKLALGIRVRMEDGSPLTWPAALWRTGLRLIDGIFFYLIGYLLANSSPHRQRLGDRIGKTVVVEKSAVGTWSGTAPTVLYVPPPPVGGIPPPPAPPIA